MQPLPAPNHRVDGPLSEPAPQRQHQCVPGCWTPRAHGPRYGLQTPASSSHHSELFDDTPSTTTPPPNCRQRFDHHHAMARCPADSVTLQPSLPKWPASQDACFSLQHQPSHLCCTPPPVPSGGHPARASFSQRTTMTAHPCMSIPAPFSLLISWLTLLILDRRHSATESLAARTSPAPTTRCLRFHAGEADGLLVTLAHSPSPFVSPPSSSSFFPFCLIPPNHTRAHGRRQSA